MGEWGMNSIKLCVSEYLAQSNPMRMTLQAFSIWSESPTGLACWSHYFILVQTGRQIRAALCDGWSYHACIELPGSQIQFHSPLISNWGLLRSDTTSMYCVRVYKTSAAIPHAHVERQAKDWKEKNQDRKGRQMSNY